MEIRVETCTKGVGRRAQPFSVGPTGVRRQTKRVLINAGIRVLAGSSGWHFMQKE